MADYVEIYGYNITKLLITNERDIDERDTDFECVLESLQQLHDNNIETLATTYLDSTQIDECDGISCNSAMKQIDQKQEHYTYYNSSNYEHHSNLLASNDSKHSYAKKREGSFPKKLFNLLEQSDTSGYSHIISWLPHGNAFKIHDENLFKQHILKKYFKSKFESFKRQLYVYGFIKIGRRSIDSGAYIHRMFVRSRPLLCIEMSTLNKTTDESIREVPNFDKIPRTLRNLC